MFDLISRDAGKQIQITQHQRRMIREIDVEKEKRSKTYFSSRKNKVERHTKHFLTFFTYCVFREEGHAHRQRKERKEKKDIGISNKQTSNPNQ